MAEPESGYTKTCLLIHGFPDLSIGWRHQIPVLMQLGFRVVCPDCIGYGISVSNPRVLVLSAGSESLHTFMQDTPDGDLGSYTLKSHADDFHELLSMQLGAASVVVAGHDW